MAQFPPPSDANNVARSDVNNEFDVGLGGCDWEYVVDEIPSTSSSNPKKRKVTNASDTEELDENLHELEAEAFDSECQEVISQANAIKAWKEKDIRPVKVLTKPQIAKHMMESIREMENILELPPTIVRTLLNQFGWDKSKLLETFCEDRAKLFKDAGLIDPVPQTTGRTYRQWLKTLRTPVFRFPSYEISEDEECTICCTLNPPMWYELQCGHKFCTSCWQQHLVTKISEQISDRILCPAYECHYTINDEAIQNLIEDRKIQERLITLIVETFVKKNRLMRFCPGPDCENALMVESVDDIDMSQVTCSCGFSCCFECGNPWHKPLKCELLKQWLEKCDKNLRSLDYLICYSRACPKCSICVKEVGSSDNHLICSNPLCKQEFCFLCLKPWEAHGQPDFECDRTIGDAVEEKALKDFQRFLCYREWYFSHMESLRVVKQQSMAIKEKMKEMKKCSVPWTDVQFLLQAMDTISTCRQTLMYTTVFAYYLKPKQLETEIFEENQGNLEIASNNLSELVEREVSFVTTKYHATMDQLASIRIKIQERTRYCEDRRLRLLYHAAAQWEC